MYVCMYHSLNACVNNMMCVLFKSTVSVIIQNVMVYIIIMRWEKKQSCVIYEWSCIVKPLSVINPELIAPT